MKRRYGYIRRKYFMDGIGNRIPMASELTWVWTAEGADILGATLFDEDGQPYELHLNSMLLRHGLDWERDRVLAHEMTHMRIGPHRSCASRRAAPYWKEEQIRLDNLGFRWL